MRQNEIVVGGMYQAKVNGRIVTVRVDKIDFVGDGMMVSGRGRKGRKNNLAYRVTNLSTGRTTTFNSAAKFRGPAKVEVASHDPNQRIVGRSVDITVADDPPYEEIISPFPESEGSDPSVDSSEVNKALVDNLTEDIRQGNWKLPGEQPYEGQHTMMERLAREEGEQCSDPTATDAVSSYTPTPTVSSVASGAAGPATSFASRIAASRNGRVVGTPVAGMVPNEEQESILALAEQGNMRVMVVAAGAGTGKTATLKMLEEVLPGRGQYTAFNASLVDESKGKFKKARCSTTHSLAFTYGPGRRYAHRINTGRMRSEQIARILGIESVGLVLSGETDSDGNPKVKHLSTEFLAGQVTMAVKKFMQSADREVDEEHFSYIDGIDAPTPSGKRGWDNNNIVRRYLVQFARKMWDDLAREDGNLPFSHDCYVKVWQLGTGQDRPMIPADYILLDEAQDTAPVFLDILKQQTQAMLVFVGDSNQAIYEWRGAVDAMKAYPKAPRRLLSQSYRFGQAIADVANTILDTLDEPTDLVMRGLPTIPSRVDVLKEARCYLYRTNAGAVSRLMSTIEDGKTAHLIGKVDEIVAWCNAALDLQARRPTSHSELGCFDTWAEVQEYSKTDEGADLRLWVKLVDSFGAAEIRDAVRNMPKEKDADVIISTAHKSKGREWDTVKLGPDFPLANRMRDEDRRLLYVAATRAKLTLDISECPPFCGGKQYSGGEDGSGAAIDVPGLTVEYTITMPTEEEQAAWLEGKKCPVPTTPAPSVEMKPTVTTSAQTTAPATTISGKFTWCQVDNKWCARGPGGVEIGTEITVTRKDNTTKQVTVRSVVRRWNDAWVYEV